jgi:hypothetical protein
LQELTKHDYDAVPRERILAAIGIRVNKPADDLQSDETIVEPEHITAQ